MRHGVRPTRALGAAAASAVTAAVLICLPASARGATLLSVDGGNPSCSPTGAGGAPYCTISQAVAALQAGGGQTIVVAAGTYRESVRLTTSGTAAAPNVVRAATGAAVTVTGAGSTPAFTVSGQYLQVSGFTVSDTATNGIAVTGSNTVTVTGNTVTRTAGHGIYVSSSSAVTISGNNATYAGSPGSSSTIRAGIYLTGTSGSTIAGNRADNDTLAGIYVGSGTSGVSVTGNSATGNAAGTWSGNSHGLAPGIDVRSGPNTVSGNVSHDNEDSGLQFYTGAHDNVVVDNVSYRNGDHGIDDLNAPNQVIVGNTIYRNFTAGINLEGNTGNGSGNGTVANNISVDNGLQSTRTKSNIRVDSLSVSSTEVDYNLVSVPTTSYVQYIWGSSSYTSLAAFRAAAPGQEVHGREGDPQWAAPDSADFHLTAGSPAIDSADSGVAGWRSADIEGRGPFDDPGVPNTGAGPRTYDDRGAYESGQATSADDPPVAALTVTPQSGTAPVAVTADASASSDTDATPISTYAFDFGDGTTAGPQAAATAAHTYQAAGTYPVRVTVADTAGQAGTATATVTVTAAGGGGGGGGSNLVANPGFETGTTGWNAQGGTACTVTPGTTAHSGTYAAVVTNTGSTALSCTLNDSPNWVATTAAGTYTASVWVRADSAATVKLRLREYSGSTLVGSNTNSVTLTPGWQQLSVSYSPQAAGSSTLDFSAWVSSAPAGFAFMVDDVAITAG